jgi:transcriptional regulator
VPQPTPLALLQGTLDALILKALSAGPAHGYGISTWIRQRTDGELDIEDGALYQALHRLERRDLVDAEWGLSDNNRRARFYRLTTRGRRELREATATWRRYATAVFKVLEPA